MKKNKHTLFLIPWHIGNSYDITLSAVRCMRRLRCFLVEDPKLSRRQFAPFLGAALAGKEFLLIPEEPDAEFLRTVLDLLKKEDVGLASSGGVPCFIDPGAWIVKAVRERGVLVTALAGASCLSTMLSLSGIKWHSDSTCIFSFVFFLEGAPADPKYVRFLKAAAREDEALVVLLSSKSFKTCLDILAPVVGERSISVFFDLTKGPSPKYPYADQVRTMSCAAWRREAGLIRWPEVGDVSMIIHPKT